MVMFPFKMNFPCKLVNISVLCNDMVSENVSCDEKILSYCYVKPCLKYTIVVVLFISDSGNLNVPIITMGAFLGLLIIIVIGCVWCKSRKTTQGPACFLIFP